MQTNTMVIKPALTVFLLIFGLSGISAQSSALATYDNLNLNVSSKTDDYALQNERQLLAVIQFLDEVLDSYKTSYAKQLETITTQTALLETNLLNIQQRLISIELLSNERKYCSQKYKARLPVVATVKSRITSCVLSAETSYKSIVTAATTTLTNMKSYMSNQYKTGLANCLKQHANAPLNYTLCIINAVAAGEANINSYRNTFNTQMQADKCSGAGRIRLALECTFTNVYSSIFISGETMNLINNCIEGKEFCPPCVTPTNPTPIDKRCPNVTDLELTPDIYTNATIKNPFLSWNLGPSSSNPSNSTKCVEVRFHLLPN